jgi:hypothetical protein
MRDEAVRAFLPADRHACRALPALAVDLLRRGHTLGARLRKSPFETQIIERDYCRESSVEEALVEMYLAEVLVGRVEDITKALWGQRRATPRSVN